MLGDNQEQSVTNGAIAVQAGNDVHITQNGLSYSEVRDVALDVFRANFLQLAGPAMATAKARAEEITEDFLKKLQQENPNGFSKGQDPDFQHALFTVQREYARNGDKDLGDLLIDLLVDRSKQEQRDILQIVLNESLSTAPKLTDSHLSALSITFLLKYTRTLSIADHEMLGEHFDTHILPFISKLATNSSCYQHLQFTGCGSLAVNITIESIFYKTYPGLFLKGLEESEIQSKGLSMGVHPSLFMRCLNDESKLQVRALNLDTLSELLKSQSISSNDQAKVTELFHSNMMSHDEIREKCISIRPYMANLFEVWSKTEMKSFVLTSVGMAIGHANIKRLTGKFSSLSIWIN